jgi:DnaJ-domain-containing protein 1
MRSEPYSFYREQLALYRKRAGAVTLGMAGTSEDLLDLLNRLSRPAERLSDLAQQLNSDEDELSAAAYAFISQRLFAAGNNHYQVLGLSSQASLGDIRQRYRLLIGLFHPDRVNRSEQWVDRAVRLLNMSYATLKHPEKRKAYDTDLQRAVQLDSSRRRATWPQSSARPRASLSRPVRLADALYRITPLQRNPKAFVWMTIASLLVLVMLLVVNRGTPTSLAPADPLIVETRMADRVPGNPLIPDFPVTVQEQATPAAEMKGPVLRQATTDPVAKHPSSLSGGAVDHEMLGNVPTESPDVPEPETQTRSKRPPVAAPLVSADRGGTQPGISFDGAREPPVGVLSDVSPTAEAVAADSSKGVVMQPEFVLMQYIRAWENGDVDGLSRLFTLDGEANGRIGRAQIGQGYTRMFKATKGRHFNLEQLKIFPLNEQGFQAWARVTARAESKQDGHEVHYTGDMILDMVPKGRRLYIARLRHNVQAAEK